MIRTSKFYESIYSEILTSGELNAFQVGTTKNKNPSIPTSSV